MHFPKIRARIHARDDARVSFPRAVSKFCRWGDETQFSIRLFVGDDLSHRSIERWIFIGTGTSEITEDEFNVSRTRASSPIRLRCSAWKSIRSRTKMEFRVMFVIAHASRVNARHARDYRYRICNRTIQSTQMHFITGRRKWTPHWVPEGGF